VEDQDAHSIAMQLSEWASRLVMSGESLDLSEWLDEGVEQLIGCAEMALMKFAQGHTLQKPLDQFTTLIDKAGQEGAHQLAVLVDEFISQMNTYVGQIQAGSQACDQPIALLDQVESLFTGLASLDPLALVWGQMDKLVDMVQAQLAASVQKALDSLRQLLCSASEESESGTGIDVHVRVSAMLEGCASSVLQWASATQLSLHIVRKVLDDFSNNEVTEAGLKVVEQVEAVLGWVKMVAAAISAHAASVTREIEITLASMKGATQKQVGDAVMEVVLETELAVTINNKQHSISLVGLPQLLADAVHEQLAQPLQDAKAQLRPLLSEVSQFPELVQLQQFIASLAAHVATLRDMLQRVKCNMDEIAEQLQTKLVQKAQKIQDALKAQTKKASHKRSRVVPNTATVQTWKATQSADIAAALAKVKLPSDTELASIEEVLLGFASTLQSIVSQGLAFIRCDAPKLSFPVPASILAELRRTMKMVHQALEGLKNQAITELKSLAEEAMVQVSDIVDDVLSEGQMDAVLEVARDVVGTAMDEWRAREEPWRVRAVSAFCLQRLRVLNSLSRHIREPVRRSLVRREVYETHPTVQSVLKADSQQAVQTNEVLLFSILAAQTMGEEQPSEMHQVAEKMSNTVGNLEAKMQKMQNFETKMETKIDQIDTKIDTKMDKMETKMDKMETKMDQLLKHRQIEDPEEVEARSTFIAEERNIVHEISLRMRALEEKREEIDNMNEPAEKQQLIVKCRKEQRELNAMAKNVSDIGKKLDIIVDFLSDLQSYLTTIDGKLDAMQNHMNSIHDDIRRLVGRPVLEAMAEQARQQLSALHSKLPQKVYIEPEVCGKGAKEIFEPDEDNPSLPVSKACEAFLRSHKNVLLLSGRAGSGPLPLTPSPSLCPSP
jgi:malonyl CoA-acyl carrier protein transacylase